MPAPDDASLDDLDDLDRPAGDERRADPVDAELEAIADEGVLEPPREVPARLSRQPRMVRFLGLGAAAGLLLAVVLTMFWPDDPTFVPANPLLSFTDLQVFAFLAAYLVPVCLGVGGLIGYVLGRVAEKRSSVDVTLERGGDQAERGRHA